MGPETMPDPILRQVALFAREHGLLATGARVLVACSGGLDSQVLLEILCALQPLLPLHLTIGHVNHGLRGSESDRDQAFVEQQAARRGLQVLVRRLDPGSFPRGRGTSLEASAREARHEALEQLRQEAGADQVALAHHLTDQAETLLFRVSRGTSLAGLAAMRPREGNRVRPLLCVTRQQLEAFAQVRGLQWVEDSSNESLAHRRNQVRHQLLPVMRQLNPQVEQALARLSEAAGRDQAYWSRVIDRLWQPPEVLEQVGEGGRRVRLSRDWLMAQDSAVGYRLLERAWHSLRLPDRAGLQLETRHLEAALTLCRRSRGTQSTCWPQGVTCVISPTFLQVGLEVPRVLEGFSTSLGLGQSVVLPDGRTLRLEASGWDQLQQHASPRLFAWVAGESVQLPLVIGLARPGQSFHPLGAPAPTRLSEFLSRQKVPRLERANIPLVFSGERLLWVVGIRSAEWARVSPSTRQPLLLSVG